MGNIWGEQKRICSVNTSTEEWSIDWRKCCCLDLSLNLNLLLENFHRYLEKDMNSRQANMISYIPRETVFVNY